MSQHFAAVWCWVFRFVGRLPGQYSVGKLNAFEQFQLQTPAWRVPLVLLLTPLPCLLFNLLLEGIPLADPALGIKASGTYQVRCFLTGIVSSTSPVIVKRDLLPEFSVASWKRISFYSVTQAVICVVTNVIIAVAADVFPVPFAQFTPIIPMSVIGKFIFSYRLPLDPQVQAQTDKIEKMLGVVLLPIFVYPAITAAFMSLTPRQQLWLSLLLPVIKLAVRRLLWIIAKDDRDLMGVITCCVGHLYHVLFTAMCLQNSKSLETLAAVALFKTVEMFSNCRRILHDAAELEAAKAQLAQQAETVDSEQSVGAMALACAAEENVASKLHASVPSRLLSTYPGYRGAEWMARHRAVLEAGAASPALDPSVDVKSEQRPQRRRSRHRMSSTTQETLPPGTVRGLSQVLPWINSPGPNVHQSSVRTQRAGLRLSILPAPRSMSTSRPRSLATQSADAIATRERVVCSLAVALHQTEMILLCSYMTMFAMSFYVLYFVALFWLPNQQFFATQHSVETFDAVQNTVAHLLLLCVMEAGFFAVYHVLIWKKLGVSGVNLLAFVLWSQRHLMQGQFMLLIVIILGFPLAHSGNGLIWNA